MPEAHDDASHDVEIACYFRGQNHCLCEQILVLCNYAGRPEAWQVATEDSELQEAPEYGPCEPMGMR